jgi:hypothetical protein
MLVLISANFIAEFFIAGGNETYGVRTAWNTVFNRVRQGRLKSALYKPTESVPPTYQTTLQTSECKDMEEMENANEVIEQPFGE